MNWSALEERADRLVMRFLRPPAIAIYFVLLAILLTLLIQPIIPYPFLFLFLASVMASAWWGGVACGLIAVALSAVASRLFIPPFYTFYIPPEGQAYFASFVCCSLAVSWVSSLKKRAEQMMLRAQEELERRVQERTAELERSHAEILAGERRLRQLTEAIPQQLWSAAADGRLLYCNQYLADNVGVEPKELAASGLVAILAPEDYEDFRAAFDKTLASGEALEGEWRARAADGSYRWRLIRALPQRAADGAIERWNGVHIDIDDLHHAKRALMLAQEKLAAHARLASMSELSASIAHEINQPLTAAVTQAYAALGWLRAAPPNLPLAIASAEHSAEEGRRAGDVVRRIRALFRRDEAEAATTSVNEILSALPRMLRDEASAAQTTIHLRLDKALPAARIDSISLQQLLINLARNGIEAMQHGEAPRVLEIESDRTGEMARISIADRGPGVPPELERKIFEAFYTTKAEGLGMGLSICRSIVEAHDGRLWVETRAGGGSIFRVTIPVSQ